MNASSPRSYSLLESSTICGVDRSEWNSETWSLIDHRSVHTSGVVKRSHGYGTPILYNVHVCTAFDHTDLHTRMVLAVSPTALARRPRVSPILPPPTVAAATPLYHCRPRIPSNCKNPNLQALSPPPSSAATPSPRSITPSPCH